MLEWLKKKLGPARTDLPAEAERLLAAHLARLDEVGRGLGERALGFVATGEDEGILEELAARQGGAKALELKCAPGILLFLPGDERERMFRRLPADPALHLRLALLYEAASRREQRGHAVDPALGIPDWLGVWLWEAGTYAPNTWRSNDESWASHGLVEGMLTLAGERPDAAIRAALRAPAGATHGLTRFATLLAALGDLPGAAARYPDAIAEALRHGEAKHLVRVLEILAQQRVDLAPHATRVAELAASSAKTVRTRALAILRGIPDVADAPLRVLAAGGSPEERFHAVEALWELRPDEARAFLAERLEAESAPKVKKAIAAKLAHPAPAAGDGGSGEPRGEAASALALPPLPDLAPAPLPPGVRGALRRLADEWYRDGTERARRIHAQNPSWTFRDPGPVTDSHLDSMVRYLEAPGRKAAADATWKSDYRWPLGEEEVKAFLSQPGIGLVHAVRFLALAGFAEEWQGGLRGGVLVDRLLRHHRAAHRLTYGLREVGAALALCDLDPALLGGTAIHGWGRRLFDWEPAAVWPYFQEHPEALEEALELRPSTDDRFHLSARRQTSAIEVLARFPRVPERFTGKLWAIALGAAKADRAAAQRCLAKEPGTRDRVVAALADGRHEARAVAAEWLADLGDACAIPALEAALAKERHDAAKAALMGALEALGAAVDRFLDRPGLAKEAAKGLAKGIPAALSWFPHAATPAVRWADSGEEVPADVVRWWIVQSHRLGSPEPGAVLRRYAQKLEPRSREALGRVVLEAWIAEDVRPPTPAELDALANAQAQQMARWVQTPLAQLVEEMRRNLAQQPAGSAAATKGVLAVAGACAGADAAGLVQRYLKTWYGQRAAQCKALLQMLSWVEHPAAVQVVLATAARFRTAGIRKEAEACARAIAERKGWTLADLADRTIPSGGFDDEGRLELDYGGRTFEASLAEDLGIALATPDGKPIAALPDARGGDDEEKVAAAKAALAAGRKELKATVKLQGERLYEAMCTERAWSAEDWERYLNRHPVAGRLCRRLVWEARRGDARVGTFRPMGDGSHTGPRDDPFALPADATVRVAHAATTPEEERRAWAEHLAAYEVEPLFDQLGRAPRRLAEGDGARTRLEELRGHLVKAFRLRARATKLGWVRGQAEDGGCFYVYRKHFPTLALEANVEFSGSSLPEEDRTVALHALYFQRTFADGGPGAEDVPLGEVPPVLLSECWNDLAALAAEGTGFDPDWERKVQP